MMTRKIKSLKYDMGAGVVALSTERNAEAPDETYSGFNACHYTHGNPDEVAACRDMLLDVLPGVDVLVIPRQTHSLNVALVDTLPAEDLEGVDAVVTNMPGVAVAVNTADCVPVMMADAEARVVAAVHSGWRGTVGHIVARALDVMESAGAMRSRVKCVMGPSICTGCFVVGEEVAEEFAKAFPGDERIIRREYGVRPHVDLRRAIWHDLERGGVAPGNIDAVTAPCSRCNWTDWWSARRLGVDSGRTLSLVALAK